MEHLSQKDNVLYRRWWALFKAQLWVILFIHKLLLVWSYLSLFV